MPFTPLPLRDILLPEGGNSATATANLTLPSPQKYTMEGAITNSFMVGTGTATATAQTINASASMK